MSRPSIQHIMPSGHLPACLTAAGIAWVILMGPVSSGSSIWGLLSILWHVLVFWMPSSLQSQYSRSCGQGEGHENFHLLPEDLQTLPGDLLWDLPLLHASFFIQFQNVLYLPYIRNCISKSFIVLWFFQLAVRFWINCFVWSTSTLCSSTQLHSGNWPFSRNAWLLPQDSDTVTRKYLSAQSDYHPSSSLGA